MVECKGAGGGVTVRIRACFCRFLLVSGVQKQKALRGQGFCDRNG
ncbi:hypothetical protein AZ25_1858 [Bordetella holmesii 04P3421]|nr:hypothetical protein AZ25_1858 [Bordetella holmesii 04P3421]